MSAACLKEIKHLNDGDGYSAVLLGKFPVDKGPKLLVF